MVQALAVGHHRRGHDVLVAALAIEGQPASPVVAALREAGVAVRDVVVPHRAYRRERRAVADLCREFRPDIVHTHGYRVDVVDRGVAARMGIPTVTTVHGVDYRRGLKGAFYEWLQQRNYRRFDAVVAVSKRLRDDTLKDGIRPERLHLIPNAWGGLYQPLSRADARRELGLATEDVVLGFVGRFLPVKGADVFIDAVALLPEPRPIAVVIGQGEDADVLADQVRRLGLAATVRFYPDITAAGRLFAAFDTYVLSSRSEGLPIVVLESIAAGTPIVATRVGGVPEVLGEDEAWLVPSEDPAALSIAIADSLDRRSEATARAARATRRLSTTHALEPWLDRYEAVYEQLREQRARVPA